MVLLMGLFSCGGFSSGLPTIVSNIIGDVECVIGGSLGMYCIGWIHSVFFNWTSMHCSVSRKKFSKNVSDQYVLVIRMPSHIAKYFS